MPTELPELATPIDEIANICYSVNAAYCAAAGLDKPIAFKAVEESILNGIEFAVRNPKIGPVHCHINWLEKKEADGWFNGEEKSVRKKTHPLIIPYHRLPEKEKLKDKLFLAIVRALV